MKIKQKHSKTKQGKTRKNKTKQNIRSQMLPIYSTLEKINLQMKNRISTQQHEILPNKHMKLNQNKTKNKQTKRPN